MAESFAEIDPSMFFFSSVFREKCLILNYRGRGRGIGGRWLGLGLRVGGSGLD